MLKQIITFWTKLIEEIDNTINQLLKNLPLDACPFNEFKDVHKLPHEGINPHRLRIGKDVLELEMVQLFGPTRGRSRYSFADVHDEKVLDRVKELYPIVYGKLIVPKFKLLWEFAKGIMAKLVKKILVIWVSFSHEININQQGKLKLDILITKNHQYWVTNVLSTPFIDSNTSIRWKQ